MSELDGIRAMRPHFDEVIVRAGEQLATEGRLAHQFFAVVDGTLETCRDGVRGELVAGQAFGHAAMRDRGVNEASVRALTDARLLVMSHAQFRATDGFDIEESVSPMPASVSSPRLRRASVEG